MRYSGCLIRKLQRSRYVFCVVIFCVVATENILDCCNSTFWLFPLTNPFPPRFWSLYWWSYLMSQIQCVWLSRHTKWAGLGGILRPFGNHWTRAAWHCQNTTYGNVGLCGLTALQKMLNEELGELGLDTAQRLVLPVEQQHHVHHREVLTHQSQKIAEET